MRLQRPELDQLVYETACNCFDGFVFKRNWLMLAAEKRVKDQGCWQPGDDQPSRSSDEKPKGLAEIDFSISRLKKAGTLENLKRNFWYVASKSARCHCLRCHSNWNMTPTAIPSRCKFCLSNEWETEYKLNEHIAPETLPKLRSCRYPVCRWRFRQLADTLVLFLNAQ